MKLDENEYWKYVFGCDESKVKKGKKKEAYKLANKCRDKEIDRFWERGKYFWAFILGSYTALFSIYGLIFSGDKVAKDAKDYLEVLKSTPYFIKLALLITSFLSLFFCISWVLINKGSKFWQKNWEKHVDMLEDDVVGKLYKTYLNTEDKAEFSKCITNLKAYDYSVSKITLFGSIVLSFISLFVFGFNCALCIPCLEDLVNKLNFSCFAQKIITIVIIIVFIIFVVLLFSKCIGNFGEKDKVEKRVQRK